MVIVVMGKQNGLYLLLFSQGESRGDGACVDDQTTINEQGG